MEIQARTDPDHRQASAESYPIRIRHRRHSWRFGAAAGAASAVLLLPIGTGCQSTPVTGRTAFNVFTPEQDVGLGREAYQQALAGQKIVTSGPQKEMVERIMSRLVAVADDPGYEWEVRLIQDDQTVNAFALPGGKMAVYTGILPVCQTEAGLAVVMGHEIGHVVARHGTQRVSESLIVDIGTDALLALLDAGNYRDIAQTASTILLELPHSRKHESEADHIGLIYMAKAGYDPRETIAFWQRMESGTGGGPPEFLSTHPSHESRIQQLQELLPEALAKWKPR